MALTSSSMHRAAKIAVVAMLVGFSAAAVVIPASAAEAGPSWVQLSAQEQRALQPLEGLWSTIGPDRKQKWREVATRFPAMTIDEQTRIRERMVDWAKMSPTERGAARIGFEQVKTVPPAQRQAGWEAYRALPEDQRKAYADQAAQRSVPVPLTPKPVIQGANGEKAAPNAGVQPKSNIVVASPVQARSVSPSMVQATVGASTRPVNQGAKPPEHHQPGQPKIVATPEFVNRSTLLPQRTSAAADGAAKASSQ